jgi:hypothetical protein
MSAQATSTVRVTRQTHTTTTTRASILMVNTGYVTDRLGQLKIALLVRNPIGGVLYYSSGQKLFFI